MRVWRLCCRPYTRVDGEGARIAGGRWNSPGRPVVYASAHLSLAVLEVMVHLEVGYEDLPNDYVSQEIDVPDILKTLSLKVDRIDIYNTSEAQAYGDRWLNSGVAAVLDVPSAVVPKERNICLDPNHPDFKRVKVVDIEPFDFDPRLFDFY